MTDGNLKAQYIGHTDLPLTTNSINDLKAISKNSPYPNVEAVFSSPLKRCSDSAKIMFPKNDIIVINELIECDFGEFEGLTAKELENVPEFKEWLSGDMKAAPVHGESNAHFLHRICDSFEKIVNGIISAGTNSVALVCHAGVMMAILACYGLPEASMADWQADPGYGYKLRLTPSLWMQTNKLEVVDLSPVSMEELEEN